MNKERKEVPAKMIKLLFYSWRNHYYHNQAEGGGLPSSGQKGRHLFHIAAKDVSHFVSSTSP